ncbi:hypothetical protein SH467x_000388 [Pirellulaceae bacterium SH467]
MVELRKWSLIAHLPTHLCLENGDNHPAPPRDSWVNHSIGSLSTMPGLGLAATNSRTEQQMDECGLLPVAAGYKFLRYEIQTGNRFHFVLQ